jgi:hypothetical protein
MTAYKGDLKKIVREVNRTVKPLNELDDNELWDRQCAADKRAGRISGVAEHLQPTSYRKNRGK